MPIYEYQCAECGFRLEKIQKFSDDPLKDCPNCAKPALSKLVSAAAFRLKGGGWYETDFKTGSKKNILHGVGGDSSSSSASSSGSSESSGSGSAGSGSAGSGSAGSGSAGSGESKSTTSSSDSKSGKPGTTASS